MFRSATLRLTLAYLGVIMLISLIFSVVLYNVSALEVHTGLRRQLPLLRQLQPQSSVFGSGLPDVYAFERQEEASAKHRLQLRLVLANLIILGAAGAVCYWLARRTLEPIEASLEAQSRFTADASHELRTPLTAMKTEIEVALRDKRLTIEEARELLGSNLEEIAKLDALANGLLRLARHERDREASFQTVSLARVASDAAERMVAPARIKNLILANEVEPLLVRGDLEHLVELVAILLDNAIKYSPPEAVVRLASQRHGHTAWLQVIDRGPGFAATDLPRVFDRFYRGDKSRTRGLVGGYGLGLSIARQIAELHHGTLEAANDAAGGAVLTVKLPLAPDPA